MQLLPMLRPGGGVRYSGPRDRDWRHLGATFTNDAPLPTGRLSSVQRVNCFLLYCIMSNVMDFFIFGSNILLYDSCLLILPFFSFWKIKNDSQYRYIVFTAMEARCLVERKYLYHNSKMIAQKISFLKLLQKISFSETSEAFFLILSILFFLATFLSLVDLFF